jgi:hypothetical protein
MRLATWGLPEQQEEPLDLVVARGLSSRASSHGGDHDAAQVIWLTEEAITCHELWCITASS